MFLIKAFYHFMIDSESNLKRLNQKDINM